MGHNSLEAVRDHITELRRRAQYFLGIMISTWTIGIIVILVNEDYSLIAVFAFIAGGIALALAERAWSDQRRIKRKLETFGYPLPSKPEKEVK